MKALITGGMGFIGSNLANKLVSEGAEVTIIDSMIPGLGGNDFNISEIKDRVKVVKKDIRDTEIINEVVKDKEYIFHLAGQVDHKRSIENPLEDVGLRINGTISLLEACRKNNPKAKIVFSSTRAVYGEVKKIPVDEATRTNPKGMYAITSLAAENIILMYHNLYGIWATIVRLTNIYGPRHQMKRDYGIVNYFIKQALSREPITVMGSGKILRDFLYVEDACDALTECAKSKSTNGEILNIGTGKGISFIDMASQIRNLTGADIKLIEFPEYKKQLEPGDFVADDRKIKSMVGWKSKTKIEEGLVKSIDFYKRNKEWYWR